MSVKEKRAIQKKGPGSSCLGPIADLEKHLPVDWWKSIFNPVYLKTDADVVENNQATEKEIDLFLAITQCEPSDAILDLCCGQGRHTLELARRGHQALSGIDRSRYLVRLARNRTFKMGYPIKFSEGDARKIRAPEQAFDCVMIMGNSFGYFEVEKDDLKVLLETNRILRSEGILYLDVTDGAWMKEHFEKRSWEWIDEELLVCRERHLAADRCRLISRELVTHAEKGVIADQFYAERLYTFEELKKQLLAAGFVDVKKHENIKGNSFRDQDLGMMANRSIVTARAPKKGPLKPKAPKKKSLCTVLMGDPRQPDAVKRNGQYNAEDFDTINRLKAALEELDDFQFSFLDDHKNAMRKLVQSPPSFVFNLCDEGWNNDPFLELHPVAFLEMHKIPYSGAGPDCLAICYNKAWVRAIANDMELPVPSEIWIDPSNQSAAIPTTFPALVKPAYGDSSVGITEQSVVHSSEEIVLYFDKLRATMPGVPILIQEFLEGREFSVALIGNGDNIEVLPILEVDYSGLDPSLPRILGYESKWLPDSPYWNQIRYFQAVLEEEPLRQMVDSSINLFRRLRCKDYARFDFRMNKQGIPKLLEVNPNPGWCWDGKMALMASFGGISYAEMLGKILTAAMERHRP